MLITCQAGFESLLVRELAELHGIGAEANGPGWVRTHGEGDLGSVTVPGRPIESLAFAHLTLLAPTEIRGDSVNALSARVAEFFLAAIRTERIDAPWPRVWLGPAERVGLGRRIRGVETTFAEQLKKKLSRVARLAVPDLPRATGPTRGLFVFFTDFDRALVARDAWVHGPRRMADDPQAPSRSYLKVEEAYVVLGRAPRAGESVCDLGAAPGGWSYSAAKHGARVLAIDNGPLKGGALDHPQIAHRREDAFKFTPSFAGASDGRSAMDGGFDWLFCDLVEDPHHVLRHIVEPWLERRWCRHFVVNLKFGRVDPIGLLRELRAPGSVLSQRGRDTRICHLYHDREEFTVVGACVDGSAGP